MKKIIYLIIIGIIIVSCKEKIVEYNYPTKLVSTRYEVISKLRLFTSNGEITDTNIKKRYFNNYIKTDTTHFFYTNSETIITKGITDTLIYHSKDTMLIQTIWGYLPRIIKHVDGYLYLCSVDSSGLFEDYCHDCPDKEFYDDIGISKPYYKFKRAIWDQFPKYYYDYTFIVKGNPDQVRIPFLQFYMRHINDDNLIKIYHNSLYRNIFDENVINNIDLTDTIAIQEFEEIYEPLK